MFREGALVRLTRDHSQVQEMFESGIITAAEIHNHPNRNVITRALARGRSTTPTSPPPRCGPASGS